jgi:hypothetical protein
VAADGRVALVEDRPGRQQRLGAPEQLLDALQLAVAHLLRSELRELRIAHPADCAVSWSICSALMPGVQQRDLALRFTVETASGASSSRASSINL